MPNWKKLIVSGSDASLNSLNVNNSVNASTFTGSLLRIDENGTGLRMTNIGAFDNSSGDFRIFANQDLILATNGENGTAVTINQTTKDANFEGAVTASTFKGDGSQLTGISDNSSFRTSLSGSSSYTITHSLGQEFCQVSVFDSNKELTLPAEVSVVDTNNIFVSFDETFSGNIVIKS